MPAYLRWKEIGATYFFTVVTARRRPLFQHQANRRLLGVAFRDARRRMPFTIDAVVLLPDHLHLLLTPTGTTDYSALWRLIKTNFTRSLKHEGRSIADSFKGRRSGEAGVWQRRYWEHIIRDEADWRQHLDYIHLNPVKHGLAEIPGDWVWSSFRRYVREGLLDPQWPGRSPVALPDVVE